MQPLSRGAATVPVYDKCWFVLVWCWLGTIGYRLWEILAIQEFIYYSIFQANTTIQSTINTFFIQNLIIFVQIKTLI